MTHIFARAFALFICCFLSAFAFSQDLQTDPTRVLEFSTKVGELVKSKIPGELANYTTYNSRTGKMDVNSVQLAQDGFADTAVSAVRVSNAGVAQVNAPRGNLANPGATPVATTRSPAGDQPGIPKIFVAQNSGTESGRSANLASGAILNEGYNPRANNVVSSVVSSSQMPTAAAVGGASPATSTTVGRTGAMSAAQPNQAAAGVVSGADALAKSPTGDPLDSTTTAPTGPSDAAVAAIKNIDNTAETPPREPATNQVASTNTTSATSDTSSGGSGGRKSNPAAGAAPNPQAKGVNDAKAVADTKGAADTKAAADASENAKIYPPPAPTGPAPSVAPGVSSGAVATQTPSLSDQPAPTVTPPGAPAPTATPPASAPATAAPPVAAASSVPPAAPAASDHAATGSDSTGKASPASGNGAEPAAPASAANQPGPAKTSGGSASGCEEVATACKQAKNEIFGTWIIAGGTTHGSVITVRDPGEMDESQYREIVGKGCGKVTCFAEGGCRSGFEITTTCSSDSDLKKNTGFSIEGGTEPGGKANGGATSDGHTQETAPGGSTSPSGSPDPDHTSAVSPAN